MSWYAGKTTFSSKITSSITPTMFIKSVQNDPKMEPKAVPERSPRNFQRKAANFTTVDQKAPKVDQKASQKMITKRILKLQKTVWVVSFPYRKNDDNLEAVFSRFLPSLGGPRPWKSSQNVIKVCKNEGPTFSPKTSI